LGTGIQLCGLNGCGKSTLGKALAQKLGYRFIDSEALFFSGTDYTNPRSRKDAEALLAQEMAAYPNFVFTAVTGDYGTEAVAQYDYVILLEVPPEVRSQRIRQRSFQKFGSRMLPGGDLHEQEEAFFKMAEARQEDYAEKWLGALGCPVLRVDGTRPVEENVLRILRFIGKQQ